jgi:hypothetical protein
MLTRHGFTLVEAVVATVLTAFVGALLVSLLLRGQAIIVFERERMEVQRTLRSGALFASYEWSGLTPGGGDIMALGRSRLQYRGPRGLAFSCTASANAIIVRQDLRYGVRAWVAGRDSLLVYAAGDTIAGTSPRWEPLSLTGVVAGVCPDGSPGLALQTIIDPVLLPLREVLPGTPVRLFEPMESRLYQSRGAWWLGLRSLTGGGSIQPALGPLSATGFELQFRDLAGVTTTDPALVVAVTATFRASTARPVVQPWGRRPPGSIDSLVVELVSRNTVPVAMGQ